MAALLSAHLLLIDVAMAAPFACVWLEWRDAHRHDLLAGHASRRLAGMAMVTLAGGIVLGFSMLALHWWYGEVDYLAALMNLPRSRLWFGLGELCFSFAFMAAYALLWQRWRNRRWAHRTLAVAAGSNLMIHFPALFTIASITSTRAEWIGRSVDRASFQRLLLDGEVLSRVVHVWLSAVAVTGAFLMLLLLSGKSKSFCPLAIDNSIGARIDEHQKNYAAADRLIRSAALASLISTLLQMPVGLWMTLAMPEPPRELLFGGDPIASGLLAVSLCLSFFVMHSLASVVLGDDRSSQIARGVGALLVTVVLMAGVHARMQNLLGAATATGAP